MGTRREGWKPAALSPVFVQIRSHFYPSHFGMVLIILRDPGSLLAPVNSVTLEIVRFVACIASWFPHNHFYPHMLSFQQSCSFRKVWSFAIISSILFGPLVGSRCVLWTSQVSSSLSLQVHACACSRGVNDQIVPILLFLHVVMSSSKYELFFWERFIFRQCAFINFANLTWTCIFRLFRSRCLLHWTVCPVLSWPGC